jgi:hypothetical protein
VVYRIPFQERILINALLSIFLNRARSRAGGDIRIGEMKRKPGPRPAGLEAFFPILA